MKTLQTKLKGWLTNISLTTVITGLLTAQNQIIPSFTKAAGADVNWVVVAGALGALWGVLRKGTTAYKES